MGDGRLSSEWDRTAAVMALTANLHRDPKKGRAFRPSDFHPYAGGRGRRRAGIEPSKFHDLAVAEAKRRQPRRAR